MNVDQLLDLMEETLEEGTAVPFAAARRVVDVDRIRDIIDEVRNNLPDEIRDSKKIVNDREQILEMARQEGDNIVKQAEERARAMVSEQEIVKRAKKYAADMISGAKTQSDELLRSANNYCEDLLKKAEEALTRSVNGIKSTRMNLRNAAAKRPAAPAKPQR